MGRDNAYFRLLGSLVCTARQKDGSVKIKSIHRLLPGCRSLEKDEFGVLLCASCAVVACFMCPLKFTVANNIAEGKSGPFGLTSFSGKIASQMPLVIFGEHSTLFFHFFRPCPVRRAKKTFTLFGLCSSTFKVTCVQNLVDIVQHDMTFNVIRNMNFFQSPQRFPSF